MSAPTVIIVLAAIFYGRLSSASDSDPSNVAITFIGNSKNVTGGEAHVAAAGNLDHFGSTGIGCGINWNEDSGYGGDIQASSADFGLGGGYSVSEHQLDFGAEFGIGNSTINVTVSGKPIDGRFEVTLTSPQNFTCWPVEADQPGNFEVLCEKHAVGSGDK